MSHVTENILTLFRSTVLFCNTFEREREKKNVMHVIFLSHTVQSVRGHEKMEELVLNLNNFFGTNWCFFTIQEFSIHLFFFFATHPHISQKKKKPSTICAMVNRAPSRVARGRDWTCRFVPSTGILCQDGGYFPPDLTSSAPYVDIAAPPHRDPLADLFDSGSSLWHSPFTEKPFDCGNSASLGSAHHRAQFHVSAHRDDLCSGSSLCGAAVDLNKWMPVIVSFCATEFILHKRLTLLALRLPFQVRFHWFAAHLTFSAAVSTPKSAAPGQMGTPSAQMWPTISFPSDLSPRESICQTGLGPPRLCGLSLLCRTVPHRATDACGSYLDTYCDR